MALPITCIKCEKEITNEEICCAAFDKEGKPIKPICQECHREYHRKEDAAPEPCFLGANRITWVEPGEPIPPNRTYEEVVKKLPSKK